MAFKTGIVVMAPDGDPNVHRALVKTSKLEFMLVVAKGGDFDEAADLCRALVQNDGVQSIFLCPAFTNEAVAKVQKAVGDEVAVNVTRGDGPANVIVDRIFEQEGFTH